MDPSQKIRALIDWGTIAHRISKITGVPNNTVVRIWSGVTEIKSVKLETAEKLAAYYDMIECNLSKAIATLDVLIYKLDANYQNNCNLLQKTKKEPYKLFERLNKVALDLNAKAKISDYQFYSNEIDELMSVIDIDIAYNIQLSDMITYYMSIQRNKLNTQKGEGSYEF